MIEMAEIRKKKKLTQAELGQAVGMAQRTIAAYESGERRPSIEAAKRIGAVLGFDWTRFYEDDEGESDDVDGF